MHGVRARPGDRLARPAPGLGGSDARRHRERGSRRRIARGLGLVRPGSREGRLRGVRGVHRVPAPQPPREGERGAVAEVLGVLLRGVAVVRPGAERGVRGGGLEGVRPPNPEREPALRVSRRLRAANAAGGLRTVLLGVAAFLFVLPVEVIPPRPRDGVGRFLGELGRGAEREPRSPGPGPSLPLGFGPPFPLGGAVAVKRVDEVPPRRGGVAPGPGLGPVPPRPRPERELFPGTRRGRVDVVRPGAGNRELRRAARVPRVVSSVVRRVVSSVVRRVDSLSDRERGAGDDVRLDRDVRVVVPRAGRRRVRRRERAGPPHVRAASASPLRLTFLGRFAEGGPRDVAADRVRRVRGVRVVVRRGAGAVLPGAGEERRRAGPGGRRANPEAERGTPQRRPRGSLRGPGARPVALAGFVSSRPAIAAIGGRGSMRVRGRVVGVRFRVRHRRGSAAEGDPRGGLGAFDASPRGVGDDHGDGVGAARGKLRRRRERGGEGRGPGSVRSPSRRSSLRAEIARRAGRALGRAPRRVGARRVAPHQGILGGQIFRESIGAEVRLHRAVAPRRERAREHLRDARGGPARGPRIPTRRTHGVRVVRRVRGGHAVPPDAPLPRGHRILRRHRRARGTRRAAGEGRRGGRGRGLAVKHQGLAEGERFAERRGGAARASRGRHRARRGRSSRGRQCSSRPTRRTKTPPGDEARAMNRVVPLERGSETDGRSRVRKARFDHPREPARDETQANHRRAPDDRSIAADRGRSRNVRGRFRRRPRVAGRLTTRVVPRSRTSRSPPPSLALARRGPTRAPDSNRARVFSHPPRPVERDDGVRRYRRLGGDSHDPRLRPRPARRALRPRPRQGAPHRGNPTGSGPTERRADARLAVRPRPRPPRDHMTRFVAVVIHDRADRIRPNDDDSARRPVAPSV